MARIYCNAHGDGACYAIPDTVTNLETFTIYAQPFEGSTLEDLRAWTSYDESIAIEVTEEQTLTYHTEWRNVYVDAYFTGAPVPPEPEPPKFWEKFPWLLAKAAREWRINGKY